MFEFIKSLFPTLNTDQINLILNFIRLVSYLLAVILGFLLSWFDKWRDSVKMKKNVKKMLKYEMRNNYVWLRYATDNYIIDFDYAAPHLSSQIYDAYLNKLDILDSEEMDEIYHAYYYLNSAYIMRGTIHELESRVDTDQSLEALIVKHKTNLDMFIKAAYDQFEHVIIELYKEGDKVIEEINKLRKKVG